MWEQLGGPASAQGHWVDTPEWLFSHLTTLLPPWCFGFSSRWYYLNIHMMSVLWKKKKSFCIHATLSTCTVNWTALFCFLSFFPPPDSPVLTSRVAVTVHVLDINEFPPELASPYETFVCENAKTGQVRCHVLFGLLLHSWHEIHSKSSSTNACWFFSELPTGDWSVACPFIELIWLQGSCWNLSKRAKLNLKGVDLYTHWQRVVVCTWAEMNAVFVWR